MGKNIELRKLELSNFKGIKQKTIDFNHVTSIFGQNAAGKTTIMDAWTWLLFGTDSKGNSDSNFAIKTLDANGKVIPKIEHSVTATLDVDGKEYKVQRILKEKWVKVRGDLETTFKGNTTDYFWNEVPKSKAEYEGKISELIDKNIFSLLSDPLLFNSLHWEKQRAILIGIAGEIDNASIAMGNDDYEALLKKLDDKDLEEYKKELASKRKKLNDAIRDIPSRIDEVTNNKPEALDFGALEKEKSELLEKIEKLDGEIQDRNKANESANAERQKKSDRVFELKTRNQNIEFEIKRNINAEASKESDPTESIRINLGNAKDNLERYERGVQKLESEVSDYKLEIETTEKEIVEKRKEWEDENAKELIFDAGSFKCPSCKRPLEADDIETEKERMTIDFRTDKQKSLELINKQGANLADRKKQLETSLESISKRISEGRVKVQETKEAVTKLETELAELESNKNSQQKSELTPDLKFKSELESNKEYQANIQVIKNLETDLEGGTGFDASDLTVQRNHLNNELYAIDGQLRKKEEIEKADTRIIELGEEEKKYAQQIADIEKEQFIAQEFTISKVNMIETKVNALFPVTKFKMFELQVNGAQVPTCIATYKGVGFKDLNTAGQIHCGIEIINTLCKHYGIRVPVFIDNSESIVETPSTDSQLIRLVVSENHKELKVV